MTPRSKSSDSLLTDVSTRVANLEVRVETLTRLVEALASGGNPGALEVTTGEGADQLGTLTSRQHQCLQMLLRGAHNQEIADRFAVSINTVKVYVRSIANKFSVRTRSQIVMKSSRIVEGMPDDIYMGISGGVSKTWDKEILETNGKESNSKRRAKSSK